MTDDFDMLDYVQGLQVKIIEDIIKDGNMPCPQISPERANHLSKVLKDAAQIEIGKRRLNIDQAGVDEKAVVLAFMAEMGRQKLNPHINAGGESGYVRSPALLPDEQFSDGELVQGSDANTFTDFMHQSGFDNEGNEL